MVHALGLLGLLIGLELVLGVDNVLVIAIFVGRLPKAERSRARLVGLGLAAVARILLLFLVVALTNLREPIVAGFSVRDLILVAGGLFLLWKAVVEIHHTVELREERVEARGGAGRSGWAGVISQIILLDIVFSLDSVITAVGLTTELWIIVTAVVASFALVLAFAGVIGEFILEHPALKILALAFLITIGVTIFMEGLQQHVPKAYIYLPMGFALMVEILQMRYEANRRRVGRG